MSNRAHAIVDGKRVGAITLAEAASWAGCIPYEFLCSLGRRVARVYR